VLAHQLIGRAAPPRRGNASRVGDDLAHQENSMYYWRVPTRTVTDAAATAALFHALSDPIRIEVLALLAHGERCVCDLTAALDIAQPRLSWHLKTLKDAGLVSDRREGRWSYYTLERGAFDAAESALASLRPRARRLTVRSAGNCC